MVQSLNCLRQVDCPIFHVVFLLCMYISMSITDMEMVVKYQNSQVLINVFHP